MELILLVLLIKILKKKLLLVLEKMKLFNLLDHIKELIIQQNQVIIISEIKIILLNQNIVKIQMKIKIQEAVFHMITPKVV